MKDLIEELVHDWLTAEKAAHICARDGYKVTGVVLHKDDGSCCIVDLKAVRWLTKENMWEIMHPDPNSLMRNETTS